MSALGHNRLACSTKPWALRSQWYSMAFQTSPSVHSAAQRITRIGSFKTVIGDFAGQDRSAGTENIELVQPLVTVPATKAGRFASAIPAPSGPASSRASSVRRPRAVTSFHQRKWQLGTSTSPARYKDDIKPMEKPVKRFWHSNQ